MSKPQWLKDKEQGKQILKKEPDKCITCKHYGKFVKDGKHKGREKIQIHECSIHPGCFITKYSYTCDDYEQR